MKKILLTLALILSISFSYAQQGFTVLLPNFEGQTLSQIKKYKDWNILTEVSGDLNHDHIKDVALVLETKDSIYEKRDSSNDELTKGKARVLLVFLSKNGKKIVHTQNNKFIARSYESNMDSYIEPNLSIENNQLSILNEYIRASQSYTFQFKNNEFLIIDAFRSDVDGNTNQFTVKQYNFTNHKLIVTTGYICVEEEKVIALQFDKKPKTLSDFNEMYEWEVIKDHFL